MSGTRRTTPAPPDFVRGLARSDFRLFIAAACVDLAPKGTCAYHPLCTSTICHMPDPSLMKLTTMRRLRYSTSCIYLSACCYAQAHAF
eukprot:6212886-Pleurochrysis_carterae.AAC.1